MSRERRNWKRNNIVVGFTKSRGDAWWASRGIDRVTTDGKPNHFEGPVPIEVVEEQIFNWEPEERSLYIPNPAAGKGEPKFVEVPNRKAIVRPDTNAVMGVFMGGYAIHPRRPWLLDNVANLLDDDLAIGSAGNLQGGAVSWVSVEMPQNIVTPEGEEFRPNLFAVTSCNGSFATTYKRCFTRIVCDNTLDLAYGENGAHVKVRHSKYSGLKIASTREALDILYDSSDELTAMIADLSQVKVNSRKFTKFLDILTPVPEEDKASKRAVTVAENRRAILTDLWTSDPRVEPWKGTGYGLVQMVNTFDQHYTKVQGADDENAKAFARFERSILAGVSGDLAKRTDSVIDMVKAL